MKIDGKDLKIGDNVWYKFAYEYKQSTIKNIKLEVAKDPLIIMENGDCLFIDECFFYTEKSDITDEMIKELISNAEKAIRFWNNEIIAASKRIQKTFDKIENMKLFKY